MNWNVKTVFSASEQRKLYQAFQEKRKNEAMMQSVMDTVNRQHQRASYSNSHYSKVVIRPICTNTCKAKAGPQGSLLTSPPRSESEDQAACTS
jgi:hypothetical protein